MAWKKNKLNNGDLLRFISFGSKGWRGAEENRFALFLRSLPQRPSNVLLELQAVIWSWKGFLYEPWVFHPPGFLLTPGLVKLENRLARPLKQQDERSAEASLPWQQSISSPTPHFQM